MCRHHVVIVCYTLGSFGKRFPAKEAKQQAEAEVPCSTRTTLGGHFWNYRTHGVEGTCPVAGTLHTRHCPTPPHNRKVNQPHGAASKSAGGWEQSASAAIKANMIGAHGSKVLGACARRGSGSLAQANHVNLVFGMWCNETSIKQAMKAW